jgi:hypothetical protein
MRRLGALCLCLGLTAPAFAGTGDPPAAEETPSIPWYRWLFLGERSPSTPPKPPANAASRDKPSPTAASRESAKEEAAKQLDQEQRVYLQRLQAISKIREIALEQNDEKTLKRADDLEQQAEDVYKQRTARLMGMVEKDDRATLERGRDDQSATADRSSTKRRTSGGNDR